MFCKTAIYIWFFLCYNAVDGRYSDGNYTMLFSITIPLTFCLYPLERD